MLKLDNNLLNELGLGSLPEDQKKAMLQHIYETLELRVGTNLANQMTDQQLEEFEKFIDDGGDANQAQALQWLETNLPNYKAVVNQVFEQLKGEIGQMAPQIMASSGMTPGTPVAPQPQLQSQPQPMDQSNYQAPQPVAQPAPPQPYQPPVPPQQGYQQPIPPSDYQQPFAGQTPQSMPQQQPYPQPQQPAYQPAPQGFQPPVPQPQPQQPYPPLATTDDQQPAQDSSQQAA